MLGMEATKRSWQADGGKIVNKVEEALMEAIKQAWEADGGSNVKKVEETLDAELWGKLQDYIPLQIVWEKLPYEDLSRLRLVCKAWNHSALQRLELQPYFVILPMGLSPMDDPIYLNGLVKYDVASKEFNFKRQPLPLHEASDGALGRVPPFEVEGLIFCYPPHGRHQQGIYNVHTKTWHAVPSPPETSHSVASVWGMMVYTSERPYTFTLVMGSPETKTQIYDSRSRSWSTTSSMVLQSAEQPLHLVTSEPLDQVRSYSCMCHNGCVYVSLGHEMILVYSMEEDSWTTLDYPPVIEEADHNTLGVWDGRIFTTRENCEEQAVSVWELVDLKKQEWVEYARCSEDEYQGLMSYDSEIQDEDIHEEMKLVSFICDEYVLFCNWMFQYNRADSLVMFNMKTKKWEPVDLPMGTVSIADKEDDEFGGEEMEADDEDDVDKVDEIDDEDEVDEVDEG